MSKKEEYQKNHIFDKTELENRLYSLIDKTLGELDVAGVFERTLTAPKITGIAGDVIERSVLGYPSDNRQAPDILIDNTPYEVKTTGLRRDKKNSSELVAKEPMTITDVSFNSIVNEDFEHSHFWEKASHLLIFYYLYDSEFTVTAQEYANFPFMGFDFHEFDEQDKAILKNDWELIRDFIKTIQETSPDPKSEYPRLSHELRDRLMYLDTSPKYPNPPRFRLKRTVVSEMYRKRKNRGAKIDRLPQEINSYFQLDTVCRTLEKKYKNVSVNDLMRLFGIPFPSSGVVSKNVGEQIVVKMFGGSSKKLSDIDIFKAAGLKAKTVVLSVKEKRTEDMKLVPLDFGELLNPSISYEESSIHDYFAEQQFLCIVFQEKDNHQIFGENIFKGFKRVSFPDNILEKSAKQTWLEIRELLLNKHLKETFCYSKDGSQIINKTGEPKTALNFPKSRDHLIFVRGDGFDSTKKPLLLFGIKMYRQYLWIRGDEIVKIIHEAFDKDK